ncbi:MAG TPA: hypothetical protein VF456_13175 [Vicinamibacterales bacterium]
MRNRLLALISGTALAAIGIVAAPVLLAQSTASSTKASVQRTADGHPDLSGMYDVSTMTPLQRPAEFGNRRALTKEEAAEMEQYEKQRQEKNAAPSSPNREAPPVGGDTSPTHSYLEALFRFGGGVVGGYNTFWISPGDSFAVVNGEKRTSIIIDPPDGHEPQMKAEARTRNTALRATGAVRPDAGESAETGPAGAFDGPELRPLSERCLLGFGSTSGPPSLPNYWYNNLKQVVQTKDSLMILNEMVHDARVIRIGGQHLPSSVRNWMGDSVGHWEGDVLVVDTTNFTVKTQFEGSGEHLHVVERFSRLPDGNLLYQFTVDDPTTWDRAWSGEYPWRPTTDNLYEYACHEGNYAMSNVLSGARQREKEQAGSNSKQP